MYLNTKYGGSNVFKYKMLSANTFHLKHKFKTKWDSGIVFFATAQITLSSGSILVPVTYLYL